MATITFQAKTYNYYFWSSRQRGKANMNIHGVGGETCSVWFTEDPEEALKHAEEVAPNYYAFYYHYAQLDQILDMLRNEKPVYVHYDDQPTFNNSRISTDAEPVGEGEES